MGINEAAAMLPANDSLVVLDISPSIVTLVHINQKGETMGYQALAEVLSIDKPQDDAELVEISRLGLPSQVARLLAARLGIITAELGGISTYQPDPSSGIATERSIRGCLTGS